MIYTLIFSSMMTQSLATPEHIFDKICLQYQHKKPGYFREVIGDNSQTETILYNWGLGVFLSAQNALTQLNPHRKHTLLETINMVETYWNHSGPVAGFDVNPGPHFPNDRYYDDNAWMVLALVESYEITSDEKILHLAEQAFTYCLSGLDEKLGGGIYWKEREKTSKNTCSNGPTVAAALALYKHKKDPAFLIVAKDIYNWTKKNLQDPQSKLYWDNINLEGKVEKTTWSYNSALMLRSAKGLAEATKESKYKQDAEELEKAAKAKWLKPNGIIDDEVQFAHLLFENLDPTAFDYRAYAKTLLESRNDQGLFGSKWARPAGEKNLMLHQASAVRALAIAELWSK